VPSITNRLSETAAVRAPTTPDLEQLETLAAENGRFRARHEVSESTCQQLEAELHQVRAQARELEANVERPRA
jgi:hypothetical protein